MILKEVKKDSLNPKKTRLFERQLNRIHNVLLEMGNCAKQSFELTLHLIQEKNLDHFEKITQLENQTNTLHIKIDDLCWKILARHSPVAIDLRKILASIKINSELERIADQSLNIALNVKKHFNLEKTSWPKSFSQMIKKVEKMFQLSLEAIHTNDSSLAKDIIKMDKNVNQCHSTIIRDLIQKIRDGSKNVNDIITLILVARSLERIGDHTTNIAEDIVFITSGKDIRHTNKKTRYEID